MSCEQAREDATALLGRLLGVQERMMRLQSQTWIPETSRLTLWSLTREERTLHLEWTRLEDAFLAALSEHL